MGEHPQHLLLVAALGRAGSQMIAQVPFHHAIDGLCLAALAVGLALLRSASFFIIRRYREAGDLSLNALASDGWLAGAIDSSLFQVLASRDGRT
jgi:hypothetical protein